MNYFVKFGNRKWILGVELGENVGWRSKAIGSKSKTPLALHWWIRTFFLSKCDGFFFKSSLNLSNSNIDDTFFWKKTIWILKNYRRRLYSLSDQLWSCTVPIRVQNYTVLITGWSSLYSLSRLQLNNAKHSFEYLFVNNCEQTGHTLWRSFCYTQVITQTETIDPRDLPMASMVSRTYNLRSASTKLRISQLFRA